VDIFKDIFLDNFSGYIDDIYSRRLSSFFEMIFFILLFLVIDMVKSKFSIYKSNYFA